jgi:flagellar basal body rod protein FlgF
MSTKHNMQDILGEHFPKDFDTYAATVRIMSGKLEGSNGEWIEQIYDLAWSVREYIDVQKK